jgi:hypothetical protein
MAKEVDKLEMNDIDAYQPLQKKVKKVVGHSRLFGLI